jgi:hypothetical protein
MRVHSLCACCGKRSTDLLISQVPVILEIKKPEETKVCKKCRSENGKLLRLNKQHDTTSLVDPQSSLVVTASEEAESASEATKTVLPNRTKLGCRPPDQLAATVREGRGEIARLEQEVKSARKDVKQAFEKHTKEIKEASSVINALRKGAVERARIVRQEKKSTALRLTKKTARATAALAKLAEGVRKREAKTSKFHADATAAAEVLKIADSQLNLHALFRVVISGRLLPGWFVTLCFGFLQLYTRLISYSQTHPYAEMLACNNIRCIKA